MSSFSFGKRRRRITVLQTGPLKSAAAASTVQPPRQILPRIILRPAVAPRVLVVRTQTHVAGSFQGARPRVVVVTPPQIRRFPQPISIHTRSLPNVVPPTSRWQPRPTIVPDIRQQRKWQPIVVRTNPGRLPSPKMPAPAVIVRRPPPVRPTPLTIIRTRPISASLTMLPRTVAVRLPTILRRPPTITTARTHAQVTARPAPRLLIPVQATLVRRPPALPWSKYVITTRTAIIRVAPVPRPVIVPLPRQPGRPKPIQVQTRTGQTQQKFPTRPVIVSRPPALRIWPQPIRPAVRYQLASPALHGPMPRPLILRLPGGFDLRAKANYKPTIATTPFPGSGGPLPNDLVAAIIAWLRLNAPIVAAFGDSSTTPKFGSDLAIPKTAPPYILFSEPDEDESYETIDGTGLVSSLCEGTLGCDLVGTGKLQVRLLAEQLAAIINDAPLTFADGTLIYLYRSQRKFPTFRETGPGSNVVIYKRYLEWDYKIERWAPAL